MMKRIDIWLNSHIAYIAIAFSFIAVLSATYSTITYVKTGELSHGIVVTASLASLIAAYIAWRIKRAAN